MSLIIVAKKQISIEDSLKSIEIAVKNSNINFSFTSNFESRPIYLKETKEVLVSRIDLEDDENRNENLESIEFGIDNCYMFFSIYSEIESSNFSQVYDILIDGEKYFKIAGSDNAKFEHLIYDFSMSYLKLKTDHLIILNDSYIFSFTDMQQLESNIGFYKSWYKSFLANQTIKIVNGFRVVEYSFPLEAKKKQK